MQGILARPLLLRAYQQPPYQAAIAAMPPAERIIYDKIIGIIEDAAEKHKEVLAVVRAEAKVLAEKLDDHAADDRRLFADHNTRLALIETERRLEAEAAKKIDDRKISRSTWITLLCMGGLGLAELLLHLREFFHAVLR